MQFNLSLQDTIDNALDYAISGLYKTRVGKIISFDVNSQLANIELYTKLFKITETGETIEFDEPTLLVDVRCASISGNFGRITFPVEIGDYVTIYFLDRDETNWVLTGEASKPLTDRMHDLNDAFFTTLIAPPKTKALTNFDNTAIHIETKQGSVIKVNENINLSSASGGQIDIKQKIKIANNSKNLKILLNDLASALAGATVIDPISGPLPLNPGTVSSINAFISGINSLLD
jgi:hypothetical protein